MKHSVLFILFASFISLTGCSSNPTSDNSLGVDSASTDPAPIPTDPKSTDPKSTDPKPKKPAPTNPINTTFSKWDGPYSMPLVAVAAANLTDGRILMWSAYAKMDYEGNNGAGKTFTSIFDPTTNKSNEGLVSNTHHDMFCPGTAMLADGRIMVTGGTTDNKVSIYSPVTKNWSIGSEMNVGRGYHAMTTLSDGSVFTIGGSWSGLKGGKYGEVWSENTGWVGKRSLITDQLVTHDSEGIYRADNHMWLFSAPNGLIFQAGPSKQMHWIDPTGSGLIIGSKKRGNDSDAMNGNAVMYDIGKLLTVGGARDYDAAYNKYNTSHPERAAASKHAQIIDINSGLGGVTVKKVDDMAYARVFHNSVVLPSGEIVVIGGQKRALIFSDRDSVLNAEMWNPVTEKFRTLSAMKTPRNYHSIALLMKDGRVFVAGSGLCGKNCPTNHLNAEIFTPPYLLEKNAKPAIRPVIENSPSRANPGDIIKVKVDSTKNHLFALTRLSAVTHAINNDQRRIPLVAKKLADGNYNLKIPENTSIVTSGYYFLFALNDRGVPSIAKTILINGDL